MFYREVYVADHQIKELLIFFLKAIIQVLKNKKVQAIEQCNFVLKRMSQIAKLRMFVEEKHFSSMKVFCI